MNKLLAILLSSLFATASFAAPPAAEAMKAGDPKAQAAAQAKVDAKPKVGDKSAVQPEAMKSGNAKAQGAAQAKVDAKPKVGDKSAMQPEAMKSGSAKAEAAAEAKKDKKVMDAKKP